MTKKSFLKKTLLIISILSISLLNNINSFSQVVGQAQADKLKNTALSTIVYWGNIAGSIIIVAIIVKEVWQSFVGKTKNDLVGDIIKQCLVVLIIMGILNLMGGSPIATQLITTIRGIFEQLINSIL